MRKGRPTRHTDPNGSWAVRRGGCRTLGRTTSSQLRLNLGACAGVVCWLAPRAAGAGLTGRQPEPHGRTRASRSHNAFREEGINVLSFQNYFDVEHVFFSWSDLPPIASIMIPDDLDWKMSKESFFALKEQRVFLV